MKNIPFPEANQKIAENQEEYETVEVFYNHQERSVVMCFEFTKEEIEEIVKTKQLWYKQIIPQGQMHPMNITPFKEKMIHNGKGDKG